MSAPQTPRGRTGRHGLTAGEKPDPIGYAVALLNRVAQTRALDRFGLRKPTERVVFEATRTGFRTLGAASRTFARAGRNRGVPTRVPSAAASGLFDLTPTEDEQMLVDVVARVRRRGGPPDRSRGRRHGHRSRGRAQGEPRHRPADPGRARGARRHLHRTVRDGRHARGRGARARRHGPRGRDARPRGREHGALPVGERAAAGDLPPRLHRRRRPCRGARADGASSPVRRTRAPHHGGGRR